MASISSGRKSAVGPGMTMTDASLGTSGDWASTSLSTEKLSRLSTSSALEYPVRSTPVLLFSLEGFGHAKQGQAWEFAQNGRLAFDGQMPTNTSGGHTGESYMQGWSLHVEAVRQLRGEAGDRQVADCRTVQYMCASPVVSSHILVRD